MHGQPNTLFALLLGSFLDLIRKSCAEHQCLALASRGHRTVVFAALYVGHEAHVQHPEKGKLHYVGSQSIGAYTVFFTVIIISALL
jgi:hypothetical protein